MFRRVHRLFAGLRYLEQFNSSLFVLVVTAAGIMSGLLGQAFGSAVGSALIAGLSQGIATVSLGFFLAYAVLQYGPIQRWLYKHPLVTIIGLAAATTSGLLALLWTVASERRELTEPFGWILFGALMLTLAAAFDQRTMLLRQSRVTEAPPQDQA